MNIFLNTFDDAHIFRMTDDTGMFQHARYSIPNLLEGYTTDDNARALLMAVMLYEDTQRPAILELVYRYLGFVLYAQNETGRFRNFMTYNRQFIEQAGSEDCFGRCLWALAYTQASSAMPSGIKQACAGPIALSLPVIPTFTSPRAQAHALIGLCLIESPAVDGLICELAETLVGLFETCSASDDWQWFEPYMTYDNAALPWALFAAYNRLNQDRFLTVAKKSLSFLDSVIFRDGYFRAIGCDGWLMRGGKPALFDEQPLEAYTSTLAHLTAHKATGDIAMLELARKSFAWYRGENSRHESLIDKETGGCYDGITANGLNQNQGAESIVSYAIAGLSLAKESFAVDGKRFSCCY